MAFSSSRAPFLSPPTITFRARPVGRLLVGTPPGRFIACSSPLPDVVVTRERGKNAKLIARLEQHNVKSLELPLIKHVDGPDTDRLADVLRHDKFDWITITSPEAAVVFLRGWKAAGCPKVRIAVVGAGTARVFDEVTQSDGQSLEVAFSPSKENGLSNRGFEVTRLDTYTTVHVQDVEPLTLKLAISAPVVAVASPSALRAWLNLISQVDDWNNAVACIGETTASAAKKLGLKSIYYPTTPGLDGYAHVMVSFE
ncbi:hypothetical protein PR202_ga26810 [Eleusine coracana subsp. coracana]|uniref:Uroporphyrinogen-III synthase n=1 Tax=Eleusine coracana subsp. coracana TaxID=191504 RepID=A0AAV5DF50_ELECO|nr:hypothetical protein PR202_ga26810 [Eleusine coracana subsp. coracana]